MDWIKKAAFASLLVSLLFLVNSCSMKLGLAPISSIDYTKVKRFPLPISRTGQSMYMHRWQQNLTRK